MKKSSQACLTFAKLMAEYRHYCYGHTYYDVKMSATTQEIIAAPPCGHMKQCRFSHRLISGVSGPAEDQSWNQDNI